MAVYQPDLTPLTREHGLLAALCYIRYLTEQTPEPEDLARTNALVSAARHAGMTWIQIGEAFDQTAQYVNVIFRELPKRPLPADFTCYTDPLDLEAELREQRRTAYDDPRILVPPFVLAARHAGISWQRIASALGLTRQTLHEKYRNLTPEPLPQDFEFLTHVCEIHHAR